MTFRCCRLSLQLPIGDAGGRDPVSPYSGRRQVCPVTRQMLSTVTTVPGRIERCRPDRDPGTKKIGAAFPVLVTTHRVATQHRVGMCDERIMAIQAEVSDSDVQTSPVQGLSQEEISEFPLKWQLTFEKPVWQRPSGRQRMSGIRVRSCVCRSRSRGCRSSAVKPAARACR